MRSPFLSLQFGLEPKSIGIMRLGLGLALIYDLADRWSEIEAWQTDFGVLPRVNLIEAGYYRPSLHVASGQAWFQMLLHCVHFAAAVALTLGYRTQLAAVSCWLLTVSLQNRNPLILQCGDDLLRNMLLWTVFLDAGQRLSLDNVMQYNEAALPLVDDRFAFTRRLSMATFALHAQLWSIYLCSLTLRIAPEWIGTFDALRLAMTDRLFSTPLGVIIARSGSAELHELLTLGTLWVEMYGFGIFVLAPLPIIRRRFHFARGLVVLLFVTWCGLFQLLFCYGQYPLVLASLWAAMLPKGFLDGCSVRRKATPFELHHRADGVVVRWALLFVREFFLPAPIKVTRATGALDALMVRRKARWALSKLDAPPTAKTAAPMAVHTSNPTAVPSEAPSQPAAAVVDAQRVEPPPPPPPLFSAAAFCVLCPQLPIVGLATAELPQWAWRPVARLLYFLVEIPLTLGGSTLSGFLRFDPAADADAPEEAEPPSTTARARIGAVMRAVPSAFVLALAIVSLTRTLVHVNWVQPYPAASRWNKTFEGVARAAYLQHRWDLWAPAPVPHRVLLSFEGRFRNSSADVPLVAYPPDPTFSFLPQRPGSRILMPSQRHVSMRWRQYYVHASDVLKAELLHSLADHVCFHYAAQSMLAVRVSAKEQADFSTNSTNGTELAAVVRLELLYEQGCR